MTGAINELVPTNDTVLWTSAQGAGTPLVLCHGGPGMYDYLAPVADMVDDLVTVYRHDQRGGGRSERTPPYSVRTFVDDLDGLRGHWALDKWIVGGHSWGADLALAYALRYPDRVVALMYISGTGISERYRDEYHRNREVRMSPAERARFVSLREKRKAAAGAERQRINEELTAIKERGELYDPDQVAVIPKYDEYPPNYELNAAVDEDWARTLPQDGLEASISRLDMPALIVHGEGVPRTIWPARQ